MEKRTKERIEAMLSRVKAREGKYETEGVMFQGTKKEKLDFLLSKFSQSISQIKATAIVSREGLLITAKAPTDVNERIVAALCSTVMASAETASAQMKFGNVHEISIQTEKGALLLKPSGEKALLVALVESGAQLGLITLEMETISNKISAIIEE